MVAAALAGCGVTYRASAEVLSVSLTTDPTLVGVSVGSCNAEARIDVHETPESVTFAATAIRRLDGAGDECADSVWVRLAEPMGERTAIDAKTGHELDVAPPGS